MIKKINNKIINENISDNLSVVGIVVIENGKNKVIGKNHWVGQGLETIGSYLIGGAGNGAASNIYLGSDTLIPTTVSLTGLISPIGTAPGTAPNTFNASYSINLSSTIPATVVYNATWNAGTVSGTIGEVGLYLQGYNGLSGSTYATNPGLGARMAVADGTFPSFVIDTSVALNVSWFIRFVYSSGTSVTQYITKPSLLSLSGDPSQQPIVSITNSQNTPVPAGIQVMLQAPISGLQAYFNQYYGINLNSNLSNMRILYNGQYVPAWIESINNGIATIWMKTPVSIPANSSIALSLNAGPSFNFDGVYWGEAPQLSPTYGQYDNGANVFNNYWNFAGTSLPSGWTASSSGYSINNGVSLTSGYIETTSTFGSSVLDWYGYATIPTAANYWANYGWYSNSISSNPQGNGWFTYNGQSGYGYGWAPASGSPTITYTSTPAGSSTNYTFSVANDGTNAHYYLNYAVESTTYAMRTAINYIGFRTSNNNVFVQWVRVRAYPPNGVMPRVSLL